MNELKVGQKFIKDKLSREIIKIDTNEIYYINEKGKEKHCWITTFQDWVKKCEKTNSGNSMNQIIEITNTINSQDFFYCARVKDKEDLCGYGKNISEAIGNLIMNHPKQFNIKKINQKY